MLEQLYSIKQGLSLHYSKILCNFCLSKKDGHCDFFNDDHPCNFCCSYADEVAEKVIFKALTKGGDLVDFDY